MATVLPVLGHHGAGDQAHELFNKKTQSWTKHLLNSSPCPGSAPFIRWLGFRAIPSPRPPPWATHCLNLGRNSFPGCRACLTLLLGFSSLSQSRSILLVGAFFQQVMAHQCIASCPVASFLNQCSYFQGLRCHLTLKLSVEARDAQCHAQSTQQVDNEPNRLDCVSAELREGTVSVSPAACN